jgi:hypothetical protein
VKHESVANIGPTRNYSWGGIVGIQEDDRLPGHSRKRRCSTTGSVESSTNSLTSSSEGSSHHHVSEKGTEKRIVTCTRRTSDSHLHKSLQTREPTRRCWIQTSGSAPTSQLGLCTARSQSSGARGTCSGKPLKPPMICEHGATQSISESAVLGCRLCASV